MNRFSINQGFYILYDQLNNIDIKGTQEDSRKNMFGLKIIDLVLDS